MKKIIIWGTGADYDNVMSHLKADIIQGNIEIIALVSSFKELILYLDGKKIILPEEIKEYKFDYVIIANKKNEKEIKRSAIEIGIDSKHIISYNTITHDMFDFERYVKIVDNNISIVSDDCWGGIIYNTLGLCFTSPFINMAVWSEYNDKYVTDYYKLVDNLDYYLNQPLKMERESCNLYCSIGSIGDVKLIFNHSKNFAEAKELWERRVKRFNFKNYIVKKTIVDDQDAKRFSKLPLKNKIGFYNKELNLDGIVCLKNYEKSVSRQVNELNDYVRSLAKTNVDALKEYDIFKLLAQEKDFLRVK